MSCKEIKVLIKNLKKSGYEVNRRKNGHYSVKIHGRSYQFASTPSDFRAIRNIRKDIKHIESYCIA